MKSLRFHLVMQELLFKLYVTREFELKHLSLLPPPPFDILSQEKGRKRKKSSECKTCSNLSMAMTNPPHYRSRWWSIY